MILFCDIVGAILGVVGAVFVVRKKRVGFLLWIGSNIFLLTAFAAKGLYGSFGLFIIYTAINTIGFIAWSEKGKLWLSKRTARLKRLIFK